jgi:hypothetical protein
MAVSQVQAMIQRKFEDALCSVDKPLDHLFQLRRAERKAADRMENIGNAKAIAAKARRYCMDMAVIANHMNCPTDSHVPLAQRLTGQVVTFRTHGMQRRRRRKKKN